MASGERVSPNPRLDFHHAAEAWLEARSPNLTEKTVQTYRYMLDVHLIPKFGRMRLDKIDVTMLARFVAEMATPEYRTSVQRRQGGTTDAAVDYSVHTIKSALIPMSRTFVYAKRNLGYGGENIVAALDLDERPGYRQHKPKKKLGRDELDQLVEAAPTPYREIIATAIGLGTRIGETLGLRWRDIEFDGGVVAVAQQANAKRQIARLKTETAYRRIEAPGWLLTMLREQKLRSAFCGEDDLVFCTRTGRPHGHGTS